MTYSPFVFDNLVSDEDIHNVDGLAESLGVCLSDDCAIDDVDPSTDFLLNSLYQDLQDLNTICEADSYRLIDHVRTWYAATPRKDPHDILKHRFSDSGVYRGGRDQQGDRLFNSVAGGPFVLSFSPYLTPDVFELEDSDFKFWCEKLADRVQGFVDDHAGGLLGPLTVAVFPRGYTFYNVESRAVVTIAIIGNVSRRELEARMGSRVGTLCYGVLPQRHSPIRTSQYSFYDYALESALTHAYGDTPFGDFVEHLPFDSKHERNRLKGINYFEDLEDYLESIPEVSHNYYYTLWHDFEEFGI